MVFLRHKSSNLPTINNQPTTWNRGTFTSNPFISSPATFITPHLFTSKPGWGFGSAKTHRGTFGRSRKRRLSRKKTEKKNVISFRKMSFLVGEVFSNIFRLRSTDPRLHHLKLGRMTSWRHLTMQETPAKSMFQVSTPKILSLTQKSPQRHVPSYIKHLLDEFRRSPPLTSEPKGRMKPLNITSVTDSGSTGPTKKKTCSMEKWCFINLSAFSLGSENLISGRWWNIFQMLLWSAKSGFLFSLGLNVGAMV